MNAGSTGSVDKFNEARIMDPHSHPEPTPEVGLLSRRSQIVIPQLRVGLFTLRDTFFRFGQDADHACPGCSELDSVEHLLTVCSAYHDPCQRRWPPTPTKHTILTDSATKIWPFLLEVGRCCVLLPYLSTAHLGHLAAESEIVLAELPSGSLPVCVCMCGNVAWN